VLNAWVHAPSRNGHFQIVACEGIVFDTKAAGHPVFMLFPLQACQETHVGPVDLVIPQSNGLVGEPRTLIENDQKR
jgi:hypothetical protein